MTTNEQPIKVVAGRKRNHQDTVSSLSSTRTNDSIATATASTTLPLPPSKKKLKVFRDSNHDGIQKQQKEEAIVVVPKSPPSSSSSSSSNESTTGRIQESSSFWFVSNACGTSEAVMTKHNDDDHHHPHPLVTKQETDTRTAPAENTTSCSSSSSAPAAAAAAAAATMSSSSALSESAATFENSSWQGVLQRYPSALAAAVTTTKKEEGDENRANNSVNHFPLTEEASSRTLPKNEDEDESSSLPNDNHRASDHGNADVSLSNAHGVTREKEDCIRGETIADSTISQLSLEGHSDAAHRPDNHPERHRNNLPGVEANPTALNAAVACAKKEDTDNSHSNSCSGDNLPALDRKAASPQTHSSNSNNGGERDWNGSDVAMDKEKNNNEHGTERTISLDSFSPLDRNADSSDELKNGDNRPNSENSKNLDSINGCEVKREEEKEEVTSEAQIPTCSNPPLRHCRTTLVPSPVSMSTTPKSSNDSSATSARSTTNITTAAANAASTPFACSTTDSTAAMQLQNQKSRTCAGNKAFQETREEGMVIAAPNISLSSQPPPSSSDATNMDSTTDDAATDEFCKPEDAHFIWNNDLELNGPIMPNSVPAETMSSSSESPDASLQGFENDPSALSAPVKRQNTCLNYSSAHLPALKSEAFAHSGHVSQNFNSPCKNKDAEKCASNAHDAKKEKEEHVPDSEISAASASPFLACSSHSVEPGNNLNTRNPHLDNCNGFERNLITPSSKKEEDDNPEARTPGRSNPTIPVPPVVRQFPVGTPMQIGFKVDRTLRAFQGSVQPHRHVPEKGNNVTRNCVLRTDGDTEEMHDDQLAALSETDEIEKSNNYYSTNDGNARTSTKTLGVKEKARQQNGNKFGNAHVLSEDSPNPSTPHMARRYPVGTLIYKRFNAGVFQGRVLGHRDRHARGGRKKKQVKTATINWIVYEDGDTEEMEDSTVADFDPDVAAAQNWADSEPRTHPIGTKIFRNFDSRFMDKGIVQGHGDGPDGETINFVVYEDGAASEMSDEEVSKCLSLKQEQDATTAIKHDDEDDGVDLVVSSSADAVETEDENSGSIPPASPTASDLVASVGESLTSNRMSQEDAGEDSSQYSQTVDEPVAALSSTAARVLRDAALDSRIKQERENTIMSHATRERLRKATEHWIRMNRDPETGLGRYVFRRGCHAACISTVLGGSGCLANAVSPRKDSPFIRAGEFYIAGNEDFNPFVPRFPGDLGLVDNILFWEIKNRDPDQEEFHLFVQCSKSSDKRLWHGKDAAGGRLYVGVYRRTEVESVLWYKDFPESSQQIIAEWHQEFREKRNKPLPWTEEDKKRARENLGEEKWSKMSLKQKKSAAFREFFLANDFHWDATTVEFVRYDENLYKELVRIGAMYRGSARVSLDPVELGRNHF